MHTYAKQIVRVLDGDGSLADLQEGMKASQSAGGLNSSEGADYDNHSYNLKFRSTGMSSQEFTSSSEHGTTGEFAHSSSESPDVHRAKCNIP